MPNDKETSPQTGHIPLTPENSARAKDLLYIIHQCVRSKRYVFYVAVIGDQIDKEGNPMIDFHYRRVNLGIEDVRAAVADFNAAVTRDFNPQGEKDIPHG